jgi:glycogen debranching enzyme
VIAQPLQPVQPLLHDLLVCLAAPTQFWSAQDGQVSGAGAGAEGVYHADTRVLSRVELTIAGRRPETILSAPDGPGRVRVVSLARNVDGPGADPTVRVDRFRTVRPGHASERIVIRCSTPEALVAEVRISVGTDLAPMPDVKGGHTRPLVPVHAAAEALTWSTDSLTCRVTAPGAELVVDDALRPELRWRCDVAADASAEIFWEVHAEDTAAVVTAPADGAVEWSQPVVVSDDRRLPALLEQSLQDLRGLRMATVSRPHDTFLAAGAPWFFTLFGRDSIWAARMLLPLGTQLAAGTVRVLADRQGSRTDLDTGEQPGKILHEVRSSSAVLAAEGATLPPVYYGTVDATPLWICLLHDAWRWGMPADEVAALLPHVQRALNWMSEHGDSDGDGFLEYVDTSGHGLANQGWKDSGDSVQWRDGSLADGPIALCEVQGYAHEAALSGAALLDAFGLDGAQRWREWAARLAEDFRASFWVDGVDGRYPAIALDRDKRPVDTLTSNIGHLLGTGILDESESALVAAHLRGPLLNSGFGLRTMAPGAEGYWPLRYHGGAVWPHDTAIAISGLSRVGHVAEAATLIEALLATSMSVGYRLPELFGGDSRSDSPGPVPYPAACRPQAWSAASAVALLAAALGISPDVPAGSLTVYPAVPSPFGAVRVEGLRIGNEPLAVDLAADGTLLEVQAPTGLTVLHESTP